MSAIFLDAAEPLALSAIVVGVYVGARLHLYQNNYIPVDTSVIGNFTEATFSGYASQMTAMAAATEVAGKAVSVDAAARTFAHNGGGTANTVYGYYVTDAANAVALWAERFGAPISLSAVPDQIQITLQLTLDSANH